MSLESKFQADLKAAIMQRMPGAVVLKNDPTYIQGIPDLIVLYNGRYAMLECKRSAKAKHQPNQDYYISKFGEQTFASFVYPENRKEVLDGMAHALGAE